LTITIKWKKNTERIGSQRTEKLSMGKTGKPKTYCGSEEAFLKLSDKKKEKVRKEAAEFFRQVGIRNEKFMRKYR